MIAPNRVEHCAAVDTDSWARSSQIWYMHKSLSCLGGGTVRVRRIGQWRLPEALYSLDHVHLWDLGIGYKWSPAMYPAATLCITPFTCTH